MTCPAGSGAWVPEPVPEKTDTSYILAVRELNEGLKCRPGAPSTILQRGDRAGASPAHQPWLHCPSEVVPRSSARASAGGNAEPRDRGPVGKAAQRIDADQTDETRDALVVSGCTVAGRRRPPHPAPRLLCRLKPLEEALPRACGSLPEDLEDVGADISPCPQEHARPNTLAWR